MALVPFAAAAGSGMFGLVSSLVRAGFMRVAGNRIAQVAGGGVAVDLTLDWLRQQALNMAPGSDAVALEEAARTASRMLGLENDEVLWPRHRDGTPITPRYFVIDLDRGRAFVTSRYYSRKSVNARGRVNMRWPRSVSPFRRFGRR